MSNKAFVFVMALIAIVLLFAGCADAANYTLTDASSPYGFWGGVWHGMIMVPDFIGSLIWDDVAVYAVNNNGAWYDFGFIGGFGFILRVLATLIKQLR